MRLCFWFSVSFLEEEEEGVVVMPERSFVRGSVSVSGC